MAISGRGDFPSSGPFFHIFLHNDQESDYEDRSPLFKAIDYSRRLNPSSFWKSDRPKKI